MCETHDRWNAAGCCLLFVIALGAGLIGCGQKSDISPVNGVVRLDGKPISKGTVRFVPAAGRAADGKIRSDGTFTLGTYGESDGAIIGLHHVAIIAYDVTPVGRTEAGRPKSLISKPLVPERYMSAGTSLLTFEVKPGENHAEFDLTSP